MDIRTGTVSSLWHCMLYCSLHVSILWRLLVYYCVFLVVWWCILILDSIPVWIRWLQYVSLFIILLKLLLSMKLMVYTLFNQTMYVSSLVSLSSSWTLCVPFLYSIFFLFLLKFLFPSSLPFLIPLSFSLYSNDCSILVPGTEQVKVIKPSGCGMIR